jgi:type III pantothenate kinase
LEAVQVFRQVREKMPEAHMLVVGPWSSRYISTTPVLKIVEKLAKAKHVTVTGYVSESDKYCLLAGADVMVSPTVYEAFGITLAEALYCKIPVVATKVGGVPYVVRDKIDGFLIKEQTNIPAFARACLRLLRNPELAKKMGQAGHERVKRKFQWDKVAQKLEDLYYRVIERNQKKK